MILLKKVSKRFGRICALRNISLEISRGSFVLLTGPSGAGKSTLLRTLYAAERPDEGEVLLGGWNVTRLRRASIPYLRRIVGIVFQDFKLLRHRTTLQNVAVALEIRGFCGREIRRRSLAALEAVGLKERIHTQASSLSGGEQQRVAIARALVGAPAILLADEPTGNLDPDLALGILDLLARISRMGTTVVVATHDPLVVRHARSSEIIIIDQGRLVGTRQRAPGREPRPGPSPSLEPAAPEPQQGYAPEPGLGAEVQPAPAGA